MADLQPKNQNKEKLRLHLASLFFSVFTFLIFSLFIFFPLNQALNYSYEKQIYDNWVFEKNIKSDSISHTEFFSKFSRVLMNPELLNDTILSDTLSKQFTDIVINDYKARINFINDPEHQADVEEKMKQVQVLFTLTPIIVIFILIFVRGWSKVRKNIKQISEEQIKGLRLENYEKVDWYVGKNTYSYGFLIKRIILGVDYFRADSEKKKFIINHEIAHLKYKDSIIKNYLINVRKFFLILFFFLVFVSSINYAIHKLGYPYFIRGLEIARASVSGSQEQSIVFFSVANNIILLHLIFPIIVMILFGRTVTLLDRWFSNVKEYLSDKYSFLHTAEVMPDFSNSKQDRYHPPHFQRIAFLKGQNRHINAFSIFLLFLLLLNLGYSQLVNINSIYYLFILALMMLFVVLDLFYFKLHFLKFKSLIGLAFIWLLFFIWHQLFFQGLFPIQGFDIEYYYILHFGNMTLNTFAFFVIFTYFLIALFIGFLKKNRNG